MNASGLRQTANVTPQPALPVQNVAKNSATPVAQPLDSHSIVSSASFTPPCSTSSSQRSSVGLSSSIRWMTSSTASAASDAPRYSEKSHSESIGADIVMRARPYDACSVVESTSQPRSGASIRSISRGSALSGSKTGPRAILQPVINQKRPEMHVATYQRPRWRFWRTLILTVPLPSSSSCPPRRETSCSPGSIVASGP